MKQMLRFRPSSFTLGDMIMGPRARITSLGHFIASGLAAGSYSITVEAYSTAGAWDGVMIGHVPEFELAAGERKEVGVVVHAAVTVTGRVVAWPDMTPRGGVELDTRGPPARMAAPTADDGSFRLEGVSTGPLNLFSFDLDGEQDEWTRDVAMGQKVVDIGDLAFAPGKSGAGPDQFAIDGKRAAIVHAFTRNLTELGLQEGDEIVSVAGHPVATLGASSLEGLMDDYLTGDVPVVVRKNGASQLKELHLPASVLKAARSK